MKKLMVGVLVLLLLIPALSFAKTSTPDYVYGAGVQFNMSLAEVKAISGKADTETSDTLIYDGKIAGIEGYVAYFFTSDQLTQIFVCFTAERQNDNDYVSDFEDVDVSLRAKYGLPSIDNYYCWDDGAKESVTGGYGSAVRDADLIILSSWEEYGVSIDHVLAGSDGDILHSVSFAPQDADTVSDANTDGL